MIRLSVQDGSRRRMLEVPADPARIGRDPECEIHLPGSTVSRVHATVRSAGDGWELTDHDSRNGTFVNGQRLVGTFTLGRTDRVVIGEFVLVPYDADDWAAETAAADDIGPTRAQVESGLSAREVEVLRLVAAGRSDADIAAALVVEISTVRSHLDRIRDKTGARRRPELIRYAIDHGLA